MLIEEWPGARTVIIEKAGVIRYLNIRPTNTGRDLLSADELLREITKINRR